MDKLLKKVEETNQEYEEKIDKKETHFHDRIHALRDRKKKLKDRKKSKIEELKQEKQEQLENLAQQELEDSKLFKLTEEAIETFEQKEEEIERLKNHIEEICSTILDESGKQRVTVNSEITIKNNWVYKYGKSRNARHSLNYFLGEYKRVLRYMKMAAERHSLHDTAGKIEELKDLKTVNVKKRSKTVKKELEDEPGNIKIYTSHNYSYIQYYRNYSYGRTKEIEQITSEDDYESPEKLEKTIKYKEEIEEALKEFIEKQETQNQRIRDVNDNMDNIVKVRTAKQL